VSASGCAAQHLRAREGEHDVRVVLQRRPRVRVEALLEPELLSLGEQVIGRLERGGTGFDIASAAPDRDRIVWDFAARPGELDFVAGLAHGDLEVVRAAVQCVAGTVQVRCFDLRGRLHAHQVDVRDEAGEGIAATCSLATRDAAGRLVELRASADDGAVRLLATEAAAELTVAAHGHEPVRIVSSGALQRVVLRRFPALQIVLRGTPDGMPLRLRQLGSEGSWQWIDDAPFPVSSFEALQLEVVLQVDGEIAATLPLAAVPVHPGMDPHVVVELAPDQLAWLRAAHDAARR
jgi:hypothetical protein